jgi:uncharacterized membrane protein
MTTPVEIPPVPVTPEVSSEDRLWVLLCFLLTPLLPLITLFLDDKKNKTFIKYHTVPTLILGIVEVVVVGILSLIPIVNCFVPLVYIINVVYGIKAYNGTNTDIPVITDFSKQQNWS